MSNNLYKPRIESHIFDDLIACTQELNNAIKSKDLIKENLARYKLKKLNDELTYYQSAYEEYDKSKEESEDSE